MSLWTSPPTDPCGTSPRSSEYMNVRPSRIAIASVPSSGGAFSRFALGAPDSSSTPGIGSAGVGRGPPGVGSWRSGRSWPVAEEGVEGVADRVPLPPAIGGGASSSRSARRVSACSTNASLPLAMASERARSNNSRACRRRVSNCSGFAYLSRSSAFTISSKISRGSIGLSVVVVLSTRARGTRGRERIFP